MWASVFEVQYQSKSAPPSPQDFRVYSPITTTSIVELPDSRDSQDLRSGSCQQISGLVSRWDLCSSSAR